MGMGKALYDLERTGKFCCIGRDVHHRCTYPANIAGLSCPIHFIRAYIYPELHFIHFHMMSVFAHHMLLEGNTLN